MKPTQSLQKRRTSRLYNKPAPKKEKGQLDVYSAFCPSCKYTTYSRDLRNNQLRFICSCGCTWNMAEPYGKKV